MILWKISFLDLKLHFLFLHKIQHFINTLKICYYTIIPCNLRENYLLQAVTEASKQPEEGIMKYLQVISAVLLSYQVLGNRIVSLRTVFLNTEVELTVSTEWRNTNNYSNISQLEGIMNVPWILWWIIIATEYLGLHFYLCIAEIG